MPLCWECRHSSNSGLNLNPNYLLIKKAKTNEGRSPLKEFIVTSVLPSTHLYNMAVLSLTLPFRDPEPNLSAVLFYVAFVVETSISTIWYFAACGVMRSWHSAFLCSSCAGAQNFSTLKTFEVLHQQCRQQAKNYRTSLMSQLLQADSQTHGCCFQWQSPCSEYMSNLAQILAYFSKLLLDSWNNACDAVWSHEVDSQYINDFAVVELQIYIQFSCICAVIFDQIYVSHKVLIVKSIRGIVNKIFRCGIWKYMGI